MINNDWFKTTSDSHNNSINLLNKLHREGSDLRHLQPKWRTTDKYKM